ncbi:MAG: hypothetical protein ACE37B_16665 [Ilumatobacter sp.]|uniref:hypothetical protein n=1 Tax=Ilumatobacter sp. TaxID=1967498 RepID=UPI00391DCBBD
MTVLPGRWMVVGLVGVLVVVGCGSDGERASGESSGEVEVTLSSIPFCAPMDLSRGSDIGRPANVDWPSSEFAGRYSEALWEIGERYGSNPAFAVVGNRPLGDNVMEIVVGLTGEDADLEAEIEALIARKVGAEFVEFVQVRFEPTRFSAVEMDAASRQLSDRSTWDPPLPWSGGIRPQVLPSGSIMDVYRIELYDVTDADKLAERFDIPPPYDIYCIEPEPQSLASAELGDLSDG